MLTMLDYIKQQPEVMRIITSDDFRQRIFDTATALETHTRGSISKLVLIGSGTSYNAAIAASHYITIPCEVHYPYHFTLSVDLQQYDESTLFVFISQGGKSLSTYSALEKVHGNHHRRFATLALVGEENTPLALLADSQLPFGCGVENVIYRTKGFTASLLTLITLGERLSGNAENGVAINFASDCDKLDSWISQCESFFARHQPQLRDLSSMMFIGTGEHGVTALEGSLKAIETVRRPSMYFDLEEFIHGPQNAVEDNTVMIIIENAQAKDDKAYLLFKTLRDLGKRAWFIAATPARDYPAFTLSRPQTAIDEICTVIPLQIFSYLTACEVGVDLTQRGFAQLTQRIAKALP